MTLKSSQFHGSRRKVKPSKQKPLARIFISDSKVYIPVKVYLKCIEAEKTDLCILMFVDSGIFNER